MKVLGVFDGAHFSDSIIKFAAHLNQKDPVLLTGIFLPSTDYQDIMFYYLGGGFGPAYVPDIDTDDAAIEENIKRFAAACSREGLEYRVHTGFDANALEALRKETRYADLLLINSRQFYSNLAPGTQREHLHQAIHSSECAVILLPDEFEFPQSLIIAYDGSEHAVFALKQFAYLFPRLTALSTLIVYASPGSKDIPDLPYIEELAARHFPDLSFFKLDIEPKKYFSTWMTDKAGSMLITGAAGRSYLSELLKNNFSRELIQDHKLPVFIAHR